MDRGLPSLQRLIRHLQRVPYLASKNAYRVAAHFLTSDATTVAALCQAILEAKEKIQTCAICCSWTEGSPLCLICLSPSRDKTIMCVVETWHDLTAVERTAGFGGVYHILGGVLNPLEGIGTDKLFIDALLKRVEEGEVREVILGMNPTPEGEATASYIATKMQLFPLKISRFASGLPAGAALEFMDKVTVSKALAGRIPF